MLWKADKFYQLRGVERLFMYMGNLLLGDPLPVKLPLPTSLQGHGAQDGFCAF